MDIKEKEINFNNKSNDDLLNNISKDLATITVTLSEILLPAILDSNFYFYDYINDLSICQSEDYILTIIENLDISIELSNIINDNIFTDGYFKINIANDLVEAKKINILGLEYKISINEKDAYPLYVFGKYIRLGLSEFGCNEILNKVRVACIKH
jgi:hypothetical protein